MFRLGRTDNRTWLELIPEQREDLQRWAQSRTLPCRRCISCATHPGIDDNTIAWRREPRRMNDLRRGSRKTQMDYLSVCERATRSNKIGRGLAIHTYAQPQLEIQQTPDAITMITRARPVLGEKALHNLAAEESPL